MRQVDLADIAAKWGGTPSLPDSDIEDSEPAMADVPEDTNLDASVKDTWCTLVLRMICWLMLHDFDRLDVQVPKSELFGSRMTVYIS